MKSLTYRTPNYPIASANIRRTRKSVSPENNTSSIPYKTRYNEFPAMFFVDVYVLPLLYVHTCITPVDARAYIIYFMWIPANPFSH